MLERRALILAKQETVEGQEPVPAPSGIGATPDSLVVSNPTFSVNGEQITREVVLADMSPLGGVVGKYSGQVTFTLEVKGIGVEPTTIAPMKIDPILKACGLNPTYTPTTSVVYKPLTNWAAVVNSCTLWAYMDGIICKLNGCRGTLTFEGVVGTIAKFNVTMSGRLGAISVTPQAGDGIVDGAIPAAVVYQAFAIKPPPVLGVTVSVLGDSAPVLNSVGFDLANDIQEEEDMIQASGIRAFNLIGRMPTFTCNPKAVARATTDYWSKWKNASEAALTMTIGSTVWNRFVLTIPKAQLTQMNWGARNGVRTYELTGSCNRDSTGDDEIALMWN